VAVAVDAGLKALMVDVDGVLITPRLGGWAADLEADLGVSKADLAEQFFAVHWDEIVLGKAGLHERLTPVLARIAPGVSSHQLAAYWFAKDSVLDYQLLGDLALVRARGVQVHLATVQEHERAAYLWDRLGLRGQFDAMHYAADLGARKSDPAFYAAVEARTGFAGAELLLVDDTPDNVEAARAAGWRAAQWTGRDRLADLISDLGGAA
jgi:putative hydrolase of the HAD superfamily